MRTSLRLLLAGLVFASTWLIGSASASAETVSIDVRSIAANQQSTSFDSDLSDLEPKLRKVFGNYTSFRQLDRRPVSVEKGASQTIDLPGGRELRVTFEGFDGELIDLGLEIGDAFTTTLRASSGSTFFQAGLEYAGGMLILAITVERDAS